MPETRHTHAGAQRSDALRRASAVLADVAMLLAAALAVVLITPVESPTGHVPAEPAAWSVAFALAVLAIFAARGLYGTRLRLQLLEEVRLVVEGVAVAAVAVMTARVAIENQPYVAAETVRHALLAIALLAVGRGAMLFAVNHSRRRGFAGSRTLIIGAGRVGHLTARRLLAEPELGLRPIGFLDPDPLDMGLESTALPVLGSGEDFDRVVDEHGIQHVIVAFSTSSHEELLGIVRRCWQRDVPVSLVPRLFEAEGVRVTTEHLGGLPLVGVRPARPHGWRFTAKYAFDRVVAAIVLMILAPLMLVLTGLVGATMGRPILYRQRRVGRGGRTFDMLKFRTMRLAADGEGEADADWATEQLNGNGADGSATVHDRSTRLGGFLRRFSLDELPQLLNVVRGDMSLIGPRPEREGYVRMFEGQVYRYDDRHRVKAGVTGWAQVNGLRGKTSLADRVEWDNHYIENWSPWLDFKILMGTLASMLRGERR